MGQRQRQGQHQHLDHHRLEHVRLRAASASSSSPCSAPGISPATSSKPAGGDPRLRRRISGDRRAARSRPAWTTSATARRRRAPPGPAAAHAGFLLAPWRIPPGRRQFTVEMLAPSTWAPRPSSAAWLNRRRRQVCRPATTPRHGHRRWRARRTSGVYDDALAGTPEALLPLLAQPHHQPPRPPGLCLLHTCPCQPRPRHPLPAGPHRAPPLGQPGPLPAAMACLPGPPGCPPHWLQPAAPGDACCWPGFMGAATACLSLSSIFTSLTPRSAWPWWGLAGSRSARRGRGPGRPGRAAHLHRPLGGREHLPLPLPHAHQPPGQPPPGASIWPNARRPVGNHQPPLHRQPRLLNEAGLTWKRTWWKPPPLPPASQPPSA